jgi:hypothetical protein
MANLAQQLTRLGADNSSAYATAATARNPERFADAHAPTRVQGALLRQRVSHCQQRPPR